MTAGLSAVLEQEHQLIDAGLETLTGGDTAAVTEQPRVAVGQAIALLRRHIYVEEEFLFPPLRQAGLAGPVMVMVREHGQMWPLLDRLDQLLTAGQTDLADSVGRELLGRLAGHNLKEERILYPQADELMSAAELTKLTEQLATARVPRDWVSAGAATA